MGADHRFAEHSGVLAQSMVSLLAVLTFATIGAAPSIPEIEAAHHATELQTSYRPSIHDCSLNRSGRARGSSGIMSFQLVHSPRSLAIAVSS